MGVPAFFRWLCLRNPSMIKNASEYTIDEDDIEEYFHLTNFFSANPDVDNLYLDMNGIIHPCTHPQDSNVPVPVTIQDMYNNIFRYIDK